MYRIILIGITLLLFAGCSDDRFQTLEILLEDHFINYNDAYAVVVKDDWHSDEPLLSSVTNISYLPLYAYMGECLVIHPVEVGQTWTYERNGLTYTSAVIATNETVIMNYGTSSTNNDQIEGCLKIHVEIENPDNVPSEMSAEIWYQKGMGPIRIEISDFDPVNLVKKFIILRSSTELAGNKKEYFPLPGKNTYTFDWYDSNSGGDKIYEETWSFSELYYNDEIHNGTMVSYHLNTYNVTPVDYDTTVYQGQFCLDRVLSVESKLIR